MKDKEELTQTDISHLMSMCSDKIHENVDNVYFNTLQKKLEKLYKDKRYPIPDGSDE